MSDQITPAVERAGDAFTEAYQRAVREAPSNRQGQGITREDGRKCYQAGIRAGLAAALTDPDDPDSLARSLYVAYWVAQRVPAEEARRQWLVAIMPIRDRWRAVADGHRTALLGADS